MRHCCRVPRCMGHSNGSAVAGANAYDCPKPQILPQRFHVLDVFIESIGPRISSGGPPVASMIKVHELHFCSELPAPHLQACVIYAGPTVNEKGCRTLLHPGAIGLESGTVDVKEQLSAT